MDVNFVDLYFGQADAKTEAARQPEAFRNSFVDLDGVVDALLEDGRFLILGPKGTGKTAVSCYLKEVADGQGRLIQVRDGSELPIGDISKLKTGEQPGPGRSMNAWRFLLLCSLLDVILSDQASELNRDGDALQVIGKLREYGFLDPTPKPAIVSAGKTTIKVPIPGIGTVFERESASSLHLVHLIPYLEKWVARESGGAIRHIVVIDGLDSIYLNDPAYIPAMTDMVQAAYQINQRLREHQSAAHLVLLLRNDVFSRLSLPDGGKIREDWSHSLDWRVLSGSHEDSPLFDLLNRKAWLGRKSTDIVRGYLPARIQLDGGRTIEIHDYLLGLTRHTPRDLLRLMEHIRLAAQRDGSGRYMSVLPQKVIREGVLQYATKYFVDAIRDELVGIGDGSVDQGRALMDSLRDLGSRRFDAAAYQGSLSEVTGNSWDASHTRDALKWLFYAGAIGNELNAGSRTYLQFFHRRDDNDIYTGGKLVLHNSLVYAWALPWN